ncbi:hypothetical protein [Vibrio phage BONAISHI]|nr:hypothetical protein [Vibrio phage BONAISHI]
MAQTKKLARVFGKFREEYDISEVYSFLDEVRVSGDGVYRALKDVPLGTAPTDPEYWVKTVSDTKAVPAISSKGISRLGGNLSYNSSTGVLTIPRFRALFYDSSALLEIKTFLQTDVTIDPAIHNGITINASGVMAPVTVIDESETLVVSFSWAGETERPTIAELTANDFLPSKPLDMDVEYGLVVKLSDFGAKMGDPQSVEDACIRINKFMPDGSTVFIDGDYACKSTFLIENKSNFRMAYGRLFKDTLLWSGEYLVRFDSCVSPMLSNTGLKGLNGTSKNNNWGEQGLYFRACTSPVADGCFLESFGDAGLRAHSGGYDSATVPDAVSSFDVRVTACYFRYCYQNTMTPGGTNRQIWTDNVFIDSNGAAIKTASRMGEDAWGAIIANNIVLGYEEGEAFQVQGGKEMIIAGNVIRDVGISFMLSSNTDGTTDTYPTITKYGVIKIYGNIILGGRERFLFLQNRGMDLNDMDSNPIPGDLFMYDNYYEAHNSAAEGQPASYPAEAIRFFSHTYTGENSVKQRASIVRTCVIKNNTFKGGDHWMRNNCNIHGDSAVFIEDNKVLDYEGTFIDWTHEVDPDSTIGSPELHIKNNYANKCTKGVSLTLPTDSWPIERVEVRNNILPNLNQAGIVVGRDDMGFAMHVVVADNELAYPNGDDGSNHISVTCGNPSIAEGQPGENGTLKVKGNDIWDHTGTTSGRPIYVPSGARILSHMCHSNYAKGHTALSRSDNADIDTAALGVTVLT